MAVNGRGIPFNTRRELKNGDRIMLGRNDLPLTFLTRESIPLVQKSAGKPVVVQPKPAPAVMPGIAQPAPQPADDDGKTHLVPEGSQTARLVIEKSTTPGQVGQSLELLTYPSYVGRDTPLLSAEKDVSRQHIELRFDPATRKYLLTDLKSTNGVLLGGNLIEPNRPYEIRNGMRIGLGTNVLLRFEV
jgi:pSer/pThr/pTyr-binding forkhead associated (FHA) protein